MHTSSDKYKLLAFIFLFKACRKNSLRYSHETLNSCLLRTGMKMSYYTFRKYWNLCEELGLTEKIGRHTGIIGWDKCLVKLEVPFALKRKYIKLLRLQNLKEMTFSQATNWVEETYLLLGFEEQQYKIDKRDDSVLLCLANDKSIRKKSAKLIIKKAASLGISPKELATRMLANRKDKIVTGSYHLSRKTGLSQVKCNNLLQDLVAKGLIKRKVEMKVYFQGEMSFAAFDEAKRVANNALIIPSPSLDAFVQVLGSSIFLMYKHNLKN